MHLGHRCKRDFPILADSDLVFLDSGASAQKPQVVIDRLSKFYSSQYANIHRGVYQLSQEATLAYEGARERVRIFLNAKAVEEIIFTHGATESLNLVAHAWGQSNIKEGDEIVVSLLEHHANFVPWQMLAQTRGAVLRFVGLDSDGLFDFAQLESVVSEKTRLIAITHLANGYGIIPPIPEVVALAKRFGALVVLDAAQSVAHMPVDVQKLGADFVVFSGHKLYGPTGIGVLWGRQSLLEQMPPFLTGGDMIRSVSIKGSEWNDLPAKFEAGTPHIAGAIGLATAIDYLDEIGWDEIGRAEEQLVRLLENSLTEVPGVSILGPLNHHHALVTFEMASIHPHDLGQYLSSKNIAVRAGHHCAQPLLESLGISATTRASLGLYNTPEDIGRLCEALRCARTFFRV